ncbi:MAG: PaaI family thioesterase [Candidatus Angelobacter sp.]
MKPEGLGVESVENIFYRANFIRDLDIRLDKVSEGTCETSLVVLDRLRQQHGFVHGGVIATMADHAAGGAARSVSGEKDVLTVEFKINYLRPAIGDRLRCTASVLRGGKTMIVAEALVYASNAGKETLVAKLTETLFVADDPNARAGGATPRP